MKKYVLCVISVFLLTCILYGSVWENKTCSSSNIPTNSLSSLYKDNNNNLWFGSDFGAIFFTDSSFSSFNINNSGISHNYVRSFIQEDNSNLIWIGNAFGLNSFDFEQNWQSFLQQYSTPFSLEYSPDHKLLIGTNATGFYVYDDNSFINYNPSNSILLSNYIADIVVFNNEIWLSNYQGGVVRIPDLSNPNSWIIYNQENSEISANTVKDLHIINNQLWVTSESGFHVFQNNQEWVNFNTQNSLLPSDNVRALYQDTQNNIWIGTFGSGLVKIDNQNNWTIYNTSNSSITDNYITNEGISEYNGKLVIATYYNGISFFKYNWIPEFSFSNPQDISPLTIQFNIIDADEDITYMWDFENDGVIDSYDSNPLHLYQNTGCYDVKLYASYNNETQSKVFENLISFEGSGIPWQTPEILPNSMSLLTKITLNNLPVNSGDYLAVIEIADNQEIIRGLSSINYNDSLSTASVLIFLEHNNSNLIFKLWDHTNNAIYQSSVSLNGNYNENVGSFPNNLFNLDFDLQANQLLIFNAGWNIFSLTQELNNNLVSDIFSDHLNDIEVIKSENNLYYPYYPQNTLLNFELGKAYWIKVLNPFSHTLFGESLTSPISYNLHSGWNLVGSPIEQSLPLEVFFSSIFNSLLEVRGTEGIFIPNNPLSNLSDISPAKGYWVKMSNSCNLEFPVITRKSISTTPKTESFVLKPNSMLITFKINNIELGEDDQIIAYVENEIRGISNLKYYNNERFCLIQVFSDEENQPISFKIKHNSQLYELNYTANFHAFASIGNFNTETYIELNPTLLNNDIISPEITNLSVYPNPFNPTTNIKFETSQQDKFLITVYNIKGQKINTIHQGQLQAGFHQFNWDGKDNHGKELPSSIYFIKISGKSKSFIQKVTMIK